jgi:hypothetical protein
LLSAEYISAERNTVLVHQAPELTHLEKKVWFAAGFKNYHTLSDIHYHCKPFINLFSCSWFTRYFLFNNVNNLRISVNLDFSRLYCGISLISSPCGILFYPRNLERLWPHEAQTPCCYTNRVVDPKLKDFLSVFPCDHPAKLGEHL